MIMVSTGFMAESLIFLELPGSMVVEVLSLVAGEHGGGSLI